LIKKKFRGRGNWWWRRR